MNFQTTLCILFAILSTSANAQLYYLPVEIPTHPEVSQTWLGESFGADGNRLYVGGIGSPVPSRKAPAAVYQFNATTLEYIQTYDPIGDPMDDTFAYSMEYYDGILLVGAINAPSNGTFDIGAAYLIEPNSGSLVHTFDESPNATLFSEFAHDVSINDVAIIIGAPGYDPNRNGQVFVYNAANNALVIALGPDPSTPDTNYGHKVDHNDDYLIVSARGNPLTDVQGAVYVYDFVTGVRLHRFTSPVPDTLGAGEYGRDIELLGDRLFVGAGFQAPPGVRNTVTVYDLKTGNIITTLSGNAGDDNDAFGRAISAEDDTLVVGAEQDDTFDGDPTGAVYIFDLNTYQMIDKIYPPAPTSDQVLFGSRVKIQDDKIMTSSFTEDLFDSRTKTAYILREFCRPDLNLDGSIDFFDVSIFVMEMTDWDLNGVFDFFDVSKFLQAFDEGCP